MIDRHHLLECILWPNGDGTFRKIINKAKRLEELGIYDDTTMTIPIDHSIHQSMHKEFEKGTEYGIEGKKNPMYGKTGDKNPMYGKFGKDHPTYGMGYLRAGDKNWMYGRTKDKCPNWKGENVGPFALYKRALKSYRSGEISEEELQKFRDLKSKHIKERRLKCQQ